MFLALLAVPALAGTAQVEITSSRQGLQVADGANPLCTAPCELDLDVQTPVLSFTGDRFVPAVQTLSLDPGDRLHLHVKPGNKGASTAGGVFGLTAVGLLIGSTVSFAVADDKTAAGVMIGGGLVSSLIALPLTSAGKTKVTATYE